MNFSVGRLSLRICEDELDNGASGPGGVDVLCVKREEGIQRRRGERFPVQARVDGNIGAAGTHCEKRRTVLGNDCGAIAAGLLRRRLPGFRLILGESGDARSDSWIRVVAANSTEAPNARTRYGKNSRGSVIRCDGNCGHRPVFSGVSGVKNASCEGSSNDKEFVFRYHQKTGITGGESAFPGQRRGKILRRQRIPTTAIGSLQ